MMTGWSLTSADQSFNKAADLDNTLRSICYCFSMVGIAYHIIKASPLEVDNCLSAGD